MDWIVRQAEANEASKEQATEWINERTFELLKEDAYNPSNLKNFVEAIDEASDEKRAQLREYLENRDFDYTIVKDILEEVNKYVNQTQLVVLISTVLPGTVRRHLRPCITNARFIYNPYLIAMGTIKWDMVNPEMVIIGTEDGSLTGDAQELIEFYKPFMENNPRYEVGTWDEAEAIKIFYNTFISTKLGDPDHIVSRTEGDNTSGGILKVTGLRPILEDYKNRFDIWDIVFYEDNVQYLKTVCDSFNIRGVYVPSKQGH